MRRQSYAQSVEQSPVVNQRAPMFVLPVKDVIGLDGLRTHEELQATNEELQSTNEELFIVNAEHRSRISELIELNASHEHLMVSSQVAMVSLSSGCAPPV